MIQQTSKDAYGAVAPHLGRLQQIVLETLQGAQDGLTDEQLIKITGLSPNCARPRRIELVKKGLARDSSKRRQSTNGRKAIVWEAV